MLRPTTDGLVTIRPPEPYDTEVLVAGRDQVFRRFLGPGSPDPRPTACIVAGGEVVGWVDAEVGHEWLGPGEVNVGYALFAAHRGKGWVSRAVMLLLHHLAVESVHHTATLLIDRENERSFSVARRTGFAAAGVVGASHAFRRPVPPLRYTDGFVTIGPRPGGADVATGRRWVLAVDAGPAAEIAHVRCDLAADRSPPGEPCLSYVEHAAEPEPRCVERAAWLSARLLAEHTGTRRAHVLVEDHDVVGRRLAVALGAEAVERWTGRGGREVVRHVRDL